MMNSLIMKTQYKFIHFNIGTKPQGQKTDLYQCCNNRNGKELGIIKWYGPWRQYVYEPTVRAVYSIGCFEDINHFLGNLQKKKQVKRGL